MQYKEELSWQLSLISEVRKATVVFRCVCACLCVCVLDAQSHTFHLLFHKSCLREELSGVGHSLSLAYFMSLYQTAEGKLAGWQG